MRKLTIAAVLMGAVALAGCQDYGPKQGAGTLIGAAGGGLLGSQFGSGTGKLAATAAGVLIGGWLGNSVGASLDRSDQLYAERTYNRAFETTPTGTASTAHPVMPGLAPGMTAAPDGPRPGKETRDGINAIAFSLLLSGKGRRTTQRIVQRNAGFHELRHPHRRARRHRRLHRDLPRIRAERRGEL